MIHSKVHQLSLIPLASTTAEELHSLRSAYHDAFPRDERRPWEQIVHAVRTLRPYALVDAGRVVGLMTLWDLGSFVYIEHLLVYSHTRGKGTGARAIAHACKLAGTRPLVLEAEPADMGCWAVRRLAFYERLGLTIQHCDYIQPPYTQQSAPVRLHLLCSRTLSSAELGSVRDALYREVYQEV